jgi:hypothetical protein
MPLNASEPWRDLPPARCRERDRVEPDLNAKQGGTELGWGAGLVAPMYNYQPPGAGNSNIGNIGGTSTCPSARGSIRRAQAYAYHASTTHRAKCTATQAIRCGHDHEAQKKHATLVRALKTSWPPNAPQSVSSRMTLGSSYRHSQPLHHPPPLAPARKVNTNDREICWLCPQTDNFRAELAIAGH